MSATKTKTMSKSKKPTKTATERTPTASSRRRRNDAAPPELPLGAIRQIADWFFDLGRLGADGDRDDLATVERVRRAVHAGLAGRSYRVPTERDVVTVASLAVTAAERDLGVAGLSSAVASSFDVLTYASAQASPDDLGDEPGVYTCPHRGPAFAPFLRCVP
jgi:hypothetical protein